MKMVLSLHSSMEDLMALRDSLISCLGGIDLRFKEPTSREILSTFLAKSSTLSNFYSSKALKFFCEFINSLTLFSNSEGILLKFHKIVVGITIIIRGITRERPRIKVSSIRVVTKIVPTNKIHIYRFIIILNQSRQRHIIRIRRNTLINKQFHKFIHLSTQNINFFYRINLFTSRSFGVPLRINNH